MPALGRSRDYEWVGDWQDGYYALAIAVIEQARADAARDTQHIAPGRYRQQMERARHSAIEFLAFLDTLTHQTGRGAAADD